MKAIDWRLKIVVVAMVVLGLVASTQAWLYSQRAAMHALGQRPSVTYCQIENFLHYPGFEKGEIWYCGLILDGIV